MSDSSKAEEQSTVPYSLYELYRPSNNVYLIPLFYMKELTRSYTNVAYIIQTLKSMSFPMGK